MKDNYQMNPWDVNYFQRFKNFLKEKFGISIPEWHSIVIGVGSAIIGGPQLFVMILSVAISRDKAKGHLADLRKEIGYGIASFIILEYVFLPVITLIF